MDSASEQIREAEDAAVAILARGGAMTREDMIHHVEPKYGWVHADFDVDALIERLLAGGRVEAMSYGPRTIYRLRRSGADDGEP